MTSTNAYSSTGGNYAGPGGTVTQGPSYSSVTSENIDEGGSGGTATVHIETDENGQINDQTITKTVPPGSSVEIDVATSSGDGAVAIQAATEINPAINTGSASASLKSLQRAVHTLLTTAAATDTNGNATTSIVVETTASTSPNFAQIGFGAQIMLFFKQLFSIFGF